MGPAVPGFLNAANLAFGSDRPSRTELTVQLVIRVPTIVLHGDSDGVSPPVSSKRHNRFFSGP